MSLFKAAVDKAEATIPLPKSEDVVIGLYDPIDLYASANAKPLASAVPYNNGGCFIIPKVGVSFSSNYTLVVDDKKLSSDDWARTAFDIRFSVFNNSDNLEIPAVRRSSALAWGNDLLDKGCLLLWFQDGKGTSVEGVTPTLNSSPPPWLLQPGCKGDCAAYFFAKDCMGVDLAASTSNKTSKCGVVAVRAAPWESFGGIKAGSNINVVKRGSLPAMVTLHVFGVQ